MQEGSVSNCELDEVSRTYSVVKASSNSSHDASWSTMMVTPADPVHNGPAYHTILRADAAPNTQPPVPQFSHPSSLHHPPTINTPSHLFKLKTALRRSINFSNNTSG